MKCYGIRGGYLRNKRMRVSPIYLAACIVLVHRHERLYVCLWRPALGLLFANQQDFDCVHRELRLLQLRLCAMRTMHDQILPFNMCALPVLARHLQETAVLHADSRYDAVRLWLRCCAHLFSGRARCRS